MNESKSIPFVSGLAPFSGECGERAKPISKLDVVADELMMQRERVEGLEKAVLALTSRMFGTAAMVPPTMNGCAAPVAPQESGVVNIINGRSKSLARAVDRLETAIHVLNEQV